MAIQIVENASIGRVIWLIDQRCLAGRETIINDRWQNQAAQSIYLLLQARKIYIREVTRHRQGLGSDPVTF